MPKLKGLESIVIELRDERKHLVNNLRHVDAALAVLGKLEGGQFATESRHPVSASARQRMARSQKARWAKAKNQSGSNGASRVAKPMSEAIRAKLRAAYAANHPGWKPKKK